MRVMMVSKALLRYSTERSLLEPRIAGNTGLCRLARMSHRGGGERRKVARSGDGGRSRSGNHRTDLSQRACSPPAPRVFRFVARARHTTARLDVLPHSSRRFLPLSSAELQLATAGAPVGIAPGKDSRSTATPRFCVP